MKIGDETGMGGLELFLNFFYYFHQTDPIKPNHLLDFTLVHNMTKLLADVTVSIEVSIISINPATLRTDDFRRLVGSTATRAVR